MATWFVDPVLERPDFRLVVAFLWSDLHSIDSDGDSTNPASRDWTWLYVMNRAASTEKLDVELVEGACFRVASAIPWLCAATAYFLAHESGARVRANTGDAWRDAEVLVAEAAPFDVAAAVLRARASVWRKATLDDPYPNLRV